ncbi:endonuclease [Pseudomonas phage Psa21]|uniref:Endonuclease n=1 Tax=Pseudomonas phage Psa21 TaxID=2530023 RepID=A0A481W5A8_9CAUD|nr:endonuclease [Pseudomonas phage Psa21]QBJ02918.1 endonuclease [Pseudomonas phage Psa21]
MICVYTLYLPFTGVYYIGYTDNFNRRRRQHINTLRRGVHDNSFLQYAFNVDNQVIVIPEPVETIEKAIALEKQKILDHKDNPLLANIIYAKARSAEWCEAMSQSRIGTKASQETKDKMSATRTGVKQSAEWVENRAKHRRLSVTIAGTVYKSVTDAVKALGIPCNTLLRRVRNPNLKFKDYVFTS